MHNLNDNELNEGIGKAFVSYQLLKKLMTPFNKWDLYKKGIINDKGVVNKELLKKEPNLVKEIGIFDKITLSIKVLLDKYVNTKILGTLIITKFLFENKITNPDIILNTIYGIDYKNIIEENHISEKDIEMNYSLIQPQIQEIMEL